MKNHYKLFLLNSGGEIIKIVKLINTTRNHIMVFIVAFIALSLSGESIFGGDIHGGENSGDVLLSNDNIETYYKQARSLAEYGFAVNKFPDGFCHMGGKWNLKQAQKSLMSSKGKILLIPSVGNFTFSFKAANSGNPVITFRWNGTGGAYQLNLKEGELLKIDNKAKPQVLIKSKESLLKEKSSNLTLSAIDDCLSVRDSASGSVLLKFKDLDPLVRGAIILETNGMDMGAVSEIGDIKIIEHPTSHLRPSLSEIGKIEDSICTSVELLERNFHNHRSLRLDAIEYLSGLPGDPTGHVIAALCIASCDQNLEIRLAAIQAMKRLNIKPNIKAVILESLKSDHLTLRANAMRRCIGMKIDIVELTKIVVEGLMSDDRLTRKEYKYFIKSCDNSDKRSAQAIGKALRKAIAEGRGDEEKKKLQAEKQKTNVNPLADSVLEEIKKQFAKEKEETRLIALVRSVSRDHEEDPVDAGAVKFLAEALTHTSPGVRVEAAKGIRWMEMPIAWPDISRKVRNFFKENADVTAGIVKKLSEIAINDTVPARIQAIGALCELRENPELVIEMLNDKDEQVVFTAINGLCNYSRTQIRGAIIPLKKLKTYQKFKVCANAVIQYIEDTSVTGYLSKREYPPYSMKRGDKITEQVWEQAIKENQEAKRIAIASQAERVPFPNDMVSHASAQLCVGRNKEGANERLQQHIKRFNYGDNDSLEAPVFAMAFALHHSKSRYFPGDLDQATEDMYKQMMFSIVNWNSHLMFGKIINNVMSLPGTENQSLTYRFGQWFLYLDLLKEYPEYVNRKLRSGKTILESYNEWNKFIKEWLRVRALNGLWIEIGAPYSGKYSFPAILTFQVIASDPDTRKLAEMFLDVHFVDEAQWGFDNIRGGGKSRIKDQQSNGIGVFGAAQNLYYRGIPYDVKGAHVLSVSSYIPPLVAMKMWSEYQYPDRPIILNNRRLGEVRTTSLVKKDDMATASNDTVGDSFEVAKERKTIIDNSDSDDNDSGDIIVHVEDSKLRNYGYKTKNYILGSLLRDPKDKLSPICNQRQWNGITFKDGSTVAPFSVDGYGFQHENIYIFAQSPDSRERHLMKVWASSTLEKTERDGWTFFRSGKAYVAVKFLTGGHKEEAHSLIPDDPLAPVFFQGGDDDEYGDFDKFVASVFKNIIVVTDEKVEIHAPQRPCIDYYYAKTGKLSQVDGKKVNLLPGFAYISPNLVSKEGSSQVIATAGNYKVTYDFNNLSIHYEDKK